MAMALVPVATLLTVACTGNEGLFGSADNTGVPITFNVGLSNTEQLTRSASEPIALKGEGRQLWLIPTVEQTKTVPATRGTQLKKTDNLSSFGVSAFRHAANDTDLSDDTPDYFYNLEAKEVASSNPVQYQISQNYYWPKADEALTFNAYYPYGNENVRLTDLNSETKNAGPQSFYVTVAGSAKEQVDFMTAKTTTTDFTNSASPSVNLQFQHHMTAVRFVLGDQFLGGYIKSIVISGVNAKGTYTVGEGWSATQKGAVNISYMTADHLDKPIDGTANEEVTADSEMFLLIPQEFTEDDEAMITIMYHDGYHDYEVSASLAGQDAWQEGTTVTYAISSTSLTTLRISDITFASTPDGAPKTGWTKDDAIGMYVVNEDGVTLDFKNVKCVYQGVSDDQTNKWQWKVEQPIINDVQKTVFFTSGKTYYFYYPYQEGTPDGYVMAGKGAGKPADEFFSSYISSYSTVANQASEALHAQADLQVGMAQKDVYSSTVKASMERHVGLAILELKSKKIDNEYTYTLSTDANYKWTARDGSQTEVTASPTFGTNKPCKYNDLYYFFVKQATQTELNGTGTEAWSELVTLNAGASQKYEEYSTRTVVHFDQTYTLANGDIYYSTGALSKKLIDHTTYGTPVGLVFSTSPSATDKATWKHGYVMALNNAKEGMVKWAAALGLVYKAQTTITAHRDNKEGLTETNAIKAKGNATAYPAVWAALNHKAKNKSGSYAVTMTASNSGWYLPSTGQCFDICVGLGKVSSSGFTQQGVHYSQWGASDATTCFNNINNALDAITGYSVDKIANSSTLNTGTGWWWTSTEFDADGAYDILFNSGVRITIDCYSTEATGNGKTKTMQTCYVRPVLAF